MIMRGSNNQDSANKRHSMAVDNRGIQIGGTQNPIHHHQKKPFSSSNSTKSGGGNALPPTGANKMGSSIHKVAHLINGAAPTPAIPGRTIRIIVNKQRTVSTSKSANRVFNRSDAKQHSMTLNKDTSFDSKMSKSTAFSSEQGSTYLLRDSHRQTQPFSSAVHRFDPNQDFKELFNREPGPGAYSVISSAADSVITGMSHNVQGTGNGFVSKADRFSKAGMEQSSDPKINLGPGQYDPVLVEKNVKAPKFDSKTGFTLPFNENNPLNFVKPITVNIYFKQANPAVGTYDPERPRGNIPACVNVFQSAVERGNNAKQLEQASLEPAPTTYDPLQGFDLAERVKG